jgi:very-short-patch-repair endonuclease
MGFSIPPKASKETKAQVYKEHLAVNRPELMALGFWSGATEHMQHICLVCEHTWGASPGNVVGRHSGCPKCANLYQRTHDECMAELALKHPTIEAKGTFVDTSSVFDFRCLVPGCGHTWSIPINHVLNSGSGCNKCAGRLQKTTEGYTQELIDKNKPFRPLEPYQTNKTPILHECLNPECGHVWPVRPNDLLSKHSRCPECLGKESHGEKRIKSFLVENHVSFESQKKFDGCVAKRRPPFDFFIPSLNLCIEYDGPQHFRSVEFFGGEQAFAILQAYDSIKTNFCRERGLTLLRISYKEYDDIEKILSSALKNQERK